MDASGGDGECVGVVGGVGEGCEGGLGGGVFPEESDGDGGFWGVVGVFWVFPVGGLCYCVPPPYEYWFSLGDFVPFGVWCCVPCGRVFGFEFSWNDRVGDVVVCWVGWWGVVGVHGLDECEVAPAVGCGGEGEGAGFGLYAVCVCPVFAYGGE